MNNQKEEFDQNSDLDLDIKRQLITDEETYNHGRKESVGLLWENDNQLTVPKDMRYSPITEGNEAHNAEVGKSNDEINADNANNMLENSKMKSEFNPTGS